MPNTQVPSSFYVQRFFAKCMQNRWAILAWVVVAILGVIVVNGAFAGM
jgi:hypothetical protein